MAHPLHMAIELYCTTWNGYSVNEQNYMEALGVDWTILLKWNLQILCRRL